MKNKAVFLFIIGLLFVAISVSAITDDASIYYSFDADNTTGTTMLDLSGSGIDGTCANMAFNCNTVAGKLINASTFDGTNDYINITGGYDADYSEAATFALSVWINSDTLSSGDADMIWTNSNGGNSRFAVFLRDSTIRAMLYDGGGFRYSNENNVDITTNTWYHIVVNNDGTNIPDVYVNTVINTDAISNNHNANVNSQSIGSLSDNGMKNFFNGEIDEFALYPRELTTEEISALYNSGNGYNPYYPIPTATITIDINSPANESSFADDNFTVSFNYTNSLAEAGDCRLYVDDVINDTSLAIADGTNNIEIDATGVSEGTHTWMIGCNSTTSVATNSSEYTIYLDTTNPTITWVLPANTNDSVVSGVLNTDITLTDTNIYSYVYNISYSNGTVLYNYTNTSLTGSSPYSIPNLPNMTSYGGEFTAYVEVCDGHTNNDIDFDAYSYNDELRFDNNKIKIYQENKADTANIGYTKQNDRYTFEFSTITEEISKKFIVESDEYIDIIEGSKYKGHLVTGKKWIDFEEWDIDRVEITRINDYKVLVKTYSNNGKKDWKFKSIGELNCVEESVTFFSVLRNYGFTTPVLADTLQNYYYNMSYDASYISSMGVALWYNGTEYAMDESCSASLCQYSKEVRTNHYTTNISTIFEYEINSVYTNDSQQQETFIVSLDNCSTYTTSAYNYSLKDYDTSALVDGDINFNINYGYLYAYDLITQFTGVNQSSICIYPTWATTQANVWAEYTATGYDTFNYYSLNSTFDNTTNLVNLYLVNGTTAVTITVVDENDDEVEGAYISIQQYNPTSGNYEENQVLLTDFQGKAIANLVLNDVWYKFIVSLDDVVRLETTGTKITGTTLTLRLGGIDDYFDRYDDVLGIASSLTWNNATQTFSFAYIDPSATISAGCLKVIRQSANSQVTLSDVCSDFTSGTLLYEVNNTGLGQNTYVATGYVHFDEVFTLEKLSVILGKILDFGTSGVFVSFLFLIAVVMIGIWNPIIAVVLTVVGVIASILLGIFALNLEFMMLFIILAGVVLYKLSRKTQ